MQCRAERLVRQMLASVRVLDALAVFPSLWGRDTIGHAPKCHMLRSFEAAVATKILECQTRCRSIAYTFIN